VERKKISGTIEANRYIGASIVKKLVIALIALTTVLYFISVFNLDIDVPDFFYDADTPRTLLYVSDPNSAISSIRPFLFLISWILKISLGLLDPYVAWCILNLVCILIQILCIKSILRQMNISLRNISLILTNLSVLCWFFVPDTFILGITFFVLGIVIYDQGSKNYRIILSGIISTSLNLFFLLPWTIAHIVLGRKNLVKSFSTAISVFMSLASLVLVSQYLQRFRPFLPDQNLQPSINSVEPFLNVTLADKLGFFSTIDSLHWFHSPLLGIENNVLCFFTAPWTQGYSYVPGTWAIDSNFLPFWILFFATTLTLIAFLGIYFMKSEYKVFVSFIFGLELATCLLFLTYSTHPFLFAPFLLVSRISGLILFVQRYTWALIPLVSISATLTFSSLQYMP